MTDMKRSELYQLAAEAVREGDLEADTAVEIVHLLLSDRDTALYSERRKQDQEGGTN